MVSQCLKLQAKVERDERKALALAEREWVEEVQRVRREERELHVGDHERTIW